LDISIHRVTKKEQMFIRCRSPEWLSEVARFTPPMAAFIVIRSKSDRITIRPISIGSGVNAGALRGITFSVGLSSSAGCEWGRIFPI
jgi:hypothetical protein